MLCESLSFFERLSVTDAVNPGHYKIGSVEVIDLTRHMGFLDGNIVKYVSRYKQKNGLEDLYKARKYLDWLIEDEESK